MTPLLLLLGVLALFARPAAGQDTLTVVTLNLWHNRGDWPVREALMVRDLAALRPDVLLLQEVLQDVGLPNQAETLARALGMPHVHFVSTDSVGATKRYGNAVVSRLPFEATAERRLQPLDQYRTAAHVRVRVGNTPVGLYTTHLHHEQDARAGGIRAMQMLDLLDFADSTAAGGAPLVLGGDFNAEPERPEMRVLAPFRDLFAALGSGDGVTWGPNYAAGPARRIDYLFTLDDPRLVPVEASRALDTPDVQGRYPSDHSAVYARFVLP